MSALDKIDIDFKRYEGFALGQVINDNLDHIREIGGNDLHVQVCNEHWVGNFIIPSAVGFSTPIGILKGATIRICRNDQRTERLFDDLRDWNRIFRGKLARLDDSYTFSTDRKTCSICFEDYDSGEKLTVARKCGHVFHSTCLAQWRLANVTVQQVRISRVAEETIQHDCPLCRERTD